MQSNDPGPEKGPTDGIDLPHDAYRLGVDNAGRAHWHSPFDGTVWVVRDGDHVRTEDLRGRSVVDWVLFIDQRHEGWAEREPVGSGGLAGLADDLGRRIES